MEHYSQQIAGMTNFLCVPLQIIWLFMLLMTLPLFSLFHYSVCLQSLKNCLVYIYINFYVPESSGLFKNYQFQLTGRSCNHITQAVCYINSFIRSLISLNGS